MTPIEIIKLFEPWRKRYEKLAWLPVVEVGKSESVRSFFGGSPSFSSSSQWPICSSCGYPMLFFLQLELSQLPQAFDFGHSDGFLQLLYCSSDGDCPTWEPFSGAHAIRYVVDSNLEIEVPKEIPVLLKVNIVGWDQFVDFPSPEDHEKCGIEYDYDFETYQVTVKCNNPPIFLKDLNNELAEDIEVAECISIARLGEKLGGWPAWAQYASYPTCPECGCNMKLLMQIDSGQYLRYRFGDEGTAHITYCSNHPHICAFGWACS